MSQAHADPHDDAENDWHGTLDPRIDDADVRCDGAAESLAELGTHIEVAFVAKPIANGEQATLPALLKRVLEDALLLEGCGFFSYAYWKDDQLASDNRIKSRVIKQNISKRKKTTRTISPAAFDKNFCRFSDYA